MTAAAYTVAINVLGRPVMCDTIEAASAADARTSWEGKFWSEADTFRAQILTMSDEDRPYAERMLVHMEAERAEALKWGITVTARPSRAKASSPAA